MTHSNANNPWFAVSMGLMGLIVGYGIATIQAGGTPVHFGRTVVQQPTTVTPPPALPPPPGTQGTAPETDIGPVLGEDDAPVRIVEFTDFQCPFCQRNFQQTYGQIKSQYIDTGKVSYEIRNYPLSFHPMAKPAAIAAMCANEQDKFWEMHDKLFSNGSEWTSAADATAANVIFKKYAADMKLNAKNFASCVDNQETASLIDDDISAASSAGVTGTPGFWVLGPDGQAEQIVGAVPFATFQQTIDAML